MTSHLVELYGNISNLPITACKQYCLATGATQGNIAYTQTVRAKFRIPIDLRSALALLL